jgi:hypothetical protein
VKERKKKQKKEERNKEKMSIPRIVNCISKEMFLASSSCIHCMLAVHLLTQIACTCYIMLNVWVLMVWKEAILAQVRHYLHISWRN